VYINSGKDQIKILAEQVKNYSGMPGMLNKDLGEHIKTYDFEKSNQDLMLVEKKLTLFGNVSKVVHDVQTQIMAYESSMPKLEKSFYDIYEEFGEFVKTEQQPEEIDDFKKYNLEQLLDNIDRFKKDAEVLNKNISAYDEMGKSQVLKLPVWQKQLKDYRHNIDMEKMAKFKEELLSMVYALDIVKIAQQCNALHKDLKSYISDPYPQQRVGVKELQYILKQNDGYRKEYDSLKQKYGSVEKAATSVTRMKVSDNMALALERIDDVDVTIKNILDAAKQAQDIENNFVHYENGISGLVSDFEATAKLYKEFVNHSNSMHKIEKFKRDNLQPLLNKIEAMEESGSKLAQDVKSHRTMPGAVAYQLIDKVKQYNFATDVEKLASIGKQLLDMGHSLDATETTKMQKTFEYWLNSGHKNTVSEIKNLLRNGADVNFVDNNGDNVLHLALKKHNFAVVKMLLEFPFSPGQEIKLDLKNGQNNTALDLVGKIKQDFAKDPESFVHKEISLENIEKIERKLLRAVNYTQHRVSKLDAVQKIGVISDKEAPYLQKLRDFYAEREGMIKKKSKQLQSMLAELQEILSPENRDKTDPKYIEQLSAELSKTIKASRNYASKIVSPMKADSGALSVKQKITKFKEQMDSETGFLSSWYAKSDASRFEEHKDKYDTVLDSLLKDIDACAQQYQKLIKENNIATPRISTSKKYEEKSDAGQESLQSPGSPTKSHKPSNEQ
jgi:hypothetical protein